MGHNAALHRWWNSQAVGQGIALHVGLGDPRGFVAAKIDLVRQGVSIIGPHDYDWHASTVNILEKSEVIDTPLAAKAFRVIEGIRKNDPEMRTFIADAGYDRCEGFLGNEGGPLSE